MKSTVSTSSPVDDTLAPVMSDDSDCEKVSTTPAGKSSPAWHIRVRSREAPASPSPTSPANNKNYGCSSCLGVFDPFRILQQISIIRTKANLEPHKSRNSIQKSATRRRLITIKGFDLAADQEARLARKRSAAIDRQIKQDYHEHRRKAQVMVTSFSRQCEGTSLLLEGLAAYSVTTGVNLVPQLVSRQGSDRVSENATPTAKVRSAVLKELARIIGDVRNSCEIHVESDVHIRDLERVAVLKAGCQDLYHKVHERLYEKEGSCPDGDRLDEDIASEVRALWENELWLDECYKRKAKRSRAFDKILLDLLARASKPDYIPTSSDMARISHLPASFPTVICKSYEIGSTHINIVDQDNMPCCGPMHKRLYSYLSDFASALVLVDLASYSYTDPYDYANPKFNGLHDALLRFESSVRHFNRVLGHKSKVMVLLWNLPGFVEKLKTERYPFEQHFPDFDVKDRSKVLKFIGEKFAAAYVRRGGRNKVEVRCGEPGDADVVQWIASTVNTTLLDQGLCKLGVFKEKTGREAPWYGRR